MNNEIFIFTEFSKKIGYGHFHRSSRIKKYLILKKKVKLFLNKKSKFIKDVINKNPNKVIILDLKKYDQKILKLTKKNKTIIFDCLKKIKGVTNVNPLMMSKNFKNGPKYFPYPLNFKNIIKREKKRKKFNLFISQGGTDANNSLRYILRALKYLNKDLINCCFVKNPNNYNFNIKDKKIKLIQKKSFGDLRKFLSNIDIAINGCGNFCYEIGYFGIPSVYSSFEPREIKLGKILMKKIRKFL